MSFTRRAFGLSALAFAATPGLAAAPKPTQPSPGRAPFDEAFASLRGVAGIANARFAADVPEEYADALGGASILSAKPWLAISGGGENGAFGAGLLAGWSEAGTRPDFAVVTGISTGALTAPFVFAGRSWDERLRDVYTSISAADIFEFGSTPESLLDTWPLGRLIDRHVTAALLADIAAEHRRGRRLFVLTTNVDTGRPVGWNLGAIAASGAPGAEKLFQDVLLASASIPGIFPPVYLQVDTPKGRISEMHVDGGVTTPFFVAPKSVVLGSASSSLPARQVYVIVNNQLAPDFAVTPKATVAVLGRSLSAAVKAATRAALRVHRRHARHAGIDLQVAQIGKSFGEPSAAPFDRRYMARLFAYGRELGLAGQGFEPDPSGGRVASGSP